MYYSKVLEVIDSLGFKKIIKRIVDLFLSLILCPLMLIPIICLILISSFDTKIFGLFFQKRVGFKGRLFTIFKIRTLNKQQEVSKIGSFLRKSKLDELPQVFNILIGNMSFVGPRPDVIGFANKLKGEDNIILSMKPGLTGPATLKFFNEEEDISKSKKPEKLIEKYWKEKVDINKEYVLNYYLYKDIIYLYKTIQYAFKNLVI